jgi:hypothetical protein
VRGSPRTRSPARRHGSSPGAARGQDRRRTQLREAMLQQPGRGGLLGGDSPDPLGHGLHVGDEHLVNVVMPPLRQHSIHELTPCGGGTASRCHQGSWTYPSLGRWVGKIGSSRLMLPSATNTKDCWHTSQRCFSCRLTKAISSRLPQVRQRTSMVVSRCSVSRCVAVVVVFTAVTAEKQLYPP